MPQSPLSKKVGVKPGCKLLLNAPVGCPQAFDPLQEKAVASVHAGRSFALVHVFVQCKADVDSLFPQAVKSLRPGGLLWIAYPKKSSRVKAGVFRGGVDALCRGTICRAPTPPDSRASPWSSWTAPGPTRASARRTRSRRSVDCSPYLLLFSCERSRQ